MRCRLQYKYSKLKMTTGGKECELPTADSCAIMEGEDAEYDVMDFTKKSFFTKIRSFSREVGQQHTHTHTLSYNHCSLTYFTVVSMCFQRSSDGFDSVPLKSSSSLQQREEEDSDDA